MTETSKLGVFLSIEHDQRIDLTSDGQFVRGNETYIREYVGMLDSGLMAQLSNTAYKVLHALALRARILGDSRRAGAEEEFKELCELGIVTAADKGELFCFPSREQLLKDTGIGSVHTVDTALDELAELHLIRRITVAQPRFGRGYFGSNIYLIYPGSFIGKFDSGSGMQKSPSVRPNEAPTGEQKSLPAEGADGEQKVLPDSPESGEQKLLPVAGTESSLRNTANRALKRQDLLTTTTTMEAPSQNEEKGEAGKPALAESFGDLPKTHAHLFVGLVLDEASKEEMESLLSLIEEHHHRPLSRADARRWHKVAEDFREHAQAWGLNPFTLVRQAVEEAIDAGSAREGYIAPKLARAILTRWKKRGRTENRLKSQKPGHPKREIPPAVQVYRQVRRRFPAQELWEQIAQTVGIDECSLAYWQEVLTLWVARGYNPLNIEGPLQWFNAHAIPLRTAGPSLPARNGAANIHPNVQNTPPSPDQRPIERLEVIQERLRQNSVRQAATEPMTSERKEGTGEST
ncbi:MAG: hypothetical protein M1132_10360 [Chloroflexi bacterium]|nr:hypothetical protein [Chloroflexota bacterium]